MRCSWLVRRRQFFCPDGCVGKTEVCNYGTIKTAVCSHQAAVQYSVGFALYCVRASYCLVLIFLWGILIVFHRSWCIGSYPVYLSGKAVD